MTTLQAPGARIHYDVTGSGPVLLLIPGGPADSAVFTAIRPVLARHYTVLTFDPRGLGRSELDGPPPEEGLIREHADDVGRLLAEVATDPAYVFANSGGCVTAIDHVTRHPEQARAVVLHEPPLTRYLDPARFAGAPDIPEIYREQGIGAALGAFLRMAGIEPREDMATDGQRNFEYFLGHSMRAIGEYPLDVDALKTSPVRVIVGVGETTAGSPAHDGGLGLAADLGQAAEQFPGDHGGFMGHPAEFAARLHEILEER